MQTQQLQRQPGRVLETRICRERLEEVAQPFLFPHRDGVAGVPMIRHLGQCIDERATARVAARPLLEHGERHEESAHCIVHLIETRCQLSPPSTVAFEQIRRDQHILGAEAVVERALGHPGGIRDGIDPDRRDPPLVEEFGSGVEDASRTGSEGVRIEGGCIHRSVNLS